MADNTALMNLVLFLAGIGGVAFIILILAVVAFMTFYVGVSWFNVLFGVLWLGIFLSMIFTSVDLASTDPDTKRGVIIAQGVINGILVLLLGFTVYSTLGSNIPAREAYIMMAIPISLLLSIVSLSAAAMNRLAAKSPRSA
jgi:hypothetical protein